MQCLDIRTNSSVKVRAVVEGGAVPSLAIRGVDFVDFVWPQKIVELLRGAVAYAGV
jgi:hypothetical protein